MIHFFTNPETPTLDQVGGKALSLIQLTAAGMPVPPGLVLTVDFFEPWLKFLQQSPVWNNLGQNKDLVNTASKLQAQCEHLEFTEEQKNALEDALNKFSLQSDTRLFAVRSSSPEEDLEGASFAGGYETTLGVTSDNIAAAVRRSFTSCFDERIFLYKQERGIAIDQSRIAVIIQQQIDADAAGVAFSLNPLNNCYDEAVINANQGLGESVVSGEVDPDVFIVEKLTGSVIETHIGKKQNVVRLKPEGGIVRSHPENTPTPSLTSARIQELTDLLVNVETYYDKPVDIEWAFARERLFLLQARPITTYLPLPKEMLTAPGEPKRLYANSTLIEQGLQGPLSVLGTDFLAYVLNKVGGPVAEGAIGVDGITFTASGGYYMNISYAQMIGLKNASLAPGSADDARVLEILAGIDLKEYTRGQLPAKLRAMRSKMITKMLPMLGAVLDAYFRPAHVLQAYQSALPEQLTLFETFASEGRTLEQQAVELTGLLTFFYGRSGIPMILAAQLAQRRLQALFIQDMSEAQEHLVNLGIALPGNKTTEMGMMMYALASSPEIALFSSAEEFLAALSNSSLSPDFMQRWNSFVAEFGFRCPGEIDPATPRPSEQPGLIFEQLKNLSLTAAELPNFFENTQAKRETAYKALQKIAREKGAKTVKALERYYNRWLTFGGYRETPKHYVIKVVALFRRQALAAGQRLFAAGRIDHPEQIFDLTIADIDQAMTEPALDLRLLARQRSELINKIKKNKLAVRIIDSRGKIYSPPRTTGEKGELLGIPISPGIVQGRVKVLQSAAEKKLLPGEILVARATDPGWTPLFLNARGIILEIGGALQHGAVVAREYGIPCVSGLDDATSRLIDGQLVEIDGSNGVVRVLE